VQTSVAVTDYRPIIAPAARPVAEEPLEHARIAAAIRYLVDHYQEQPGLEEVAAAAGVSAFHFQRLFKRWAGISPKRFLQYVTLGHAKRLLSGEASILDTALDVGLSGPSRLHDLFVACEAMTPGQFKAMGDGMVIRYARHDGPLGRVLLGATERGICWLSFVGDDELEVLEAFRTEWSGATLIEDEAATRPLAERAFALSGGGHAPLPLHLKGTNFQIKVWEALLRIPFGHVVSYQSIARAIGQPQAVRAVGRAVGRNNISWLIPCHRVIRGTGVIHNYRWGVPAKRRLLAFEAALSEAEAAEVAA
jgi:AraC family transcriptional regulator of adaptative response/methylated-DNA-[protein]-cysteine methyltransferase